MPSVAIGRSSSDASDPKKKKQDPVEDMYNLYDTSVKKQAGDYDDIMSKFRQIYGDANNPNDISNRTQQASFNPISASYASFNPMRAEQTQYNKSPDTTSALASLQELTQTGGLTSGDQQNLRARGVSPIRAQYATAQRDMDRQRSLQGGNSPNYGAVTSKMARDQSSLIADQMDKVNANIAEMVQSGKLSAAPNYASAAQAESSLAHGIASENTANRQDANKFNAGGMFDAARFNAGSRDDANKFNSSGASDTSRFNAGANNDTRNNRNSTRLGATTGMTSLYGTTPALSNLYGDQAHRTAEFQDRTNYRKKRDAMDMIGRTYRA